jgi:hypothetical protein
VYKRLQPETPKKPPNFPPEIPGKSPTFPENFRKFPEISENPGSPPRKIGHFGGVHKRLQPETRKNSRFSPRNSGEISEISEMLSFPEILTFLGNSRKYRNFFGKTSGVLRCHVNSVSFSYKELYVITYYTYVLCMYAVKMHVSSPENKQLVTFLINPVSL